jgi:hypothetical protein
VNGVVQQGHAAAQDATENFRDDEAESRNHGPTQHGGAERRMRMSSVTVAVRRTRVIVAVRMRAHSHHSTHSIQALQPSSRAYWAV